MQLQSAVDITGSLLECDLLSMYQKYKHVIFDYRTFRKTANTARAIFQDERIKELALKWHVEACAVRKNVKKMETKRSQNRRIQKMLGRRRGARVTHVLTVDLVTNDPHNCTTKREVEATNIGYLPEIFLCGDNISLRQSSLLEAFGYTGVMVAGNDVTVGTYIPPCETDEYTKLFLKCIKQPNHVPESAIPDAFNTKDYV